MSPIPSEGFREHPSEAEARRMYRILGNRVVEIRALRRDDHPQRAPSIGYFDNADDFGDTAAGLSSAAEGDNVFSGVFMTINQLDDFFGELVTNMVSRGKGTRDSHVRRIRTLFLDLDPARKHSDGGKVCSTDAEHAAALDAADRLAQFITSLGWPPGMAVDSGNGAYLIFRVDLPNTSENVKLIGDALRTLAARVDTDTVHLDTGVGNPARIVRVAGSVNRKSPHTSERPNRLVRILSAPDDDRLETITVEQLRALADTGNESDILSTDVANATDGTDSMGFRELDDVEAEIHQRQVDAVLAYLDKVGIQPASVRDDGRFKCIDLPYCPFKGKDHTDGRTAILVWKTGTIGVKCFHAKCEGKTWADLQKALGIPFRDVARQIATRTILGKTDRVFNDPLLLAQKHLAEWAAPDGTPTLACFRGETYRYDRAEGWEKTRLRDLEPWIRQTVQEVFDEHARVVSQIEGKPKKPEPIRGQLVPDTFKAMQSLCKREISRGVQSPFWLDPVGDWEADDLLTFRNGILNVRNFIERRGEHFIPPTAKLFYEHQAQFDFDPCAPHPAEWQRFLDSLERGDMWRASLQQIMGYCLWLGYDLQKFFVLVGPPRSGKGTIATVLENLVGGEAAVCAPGLEDFTRFGLEQAIGKRLAIVPEIDLPRKHREIIARLKAITGGDLVTVDRKHIPNLSVRLKMKILMQTNHFVALPDNSGALHARMLPLKFTKSFVGQEDTQLAEKLAAEYPGILLWALEGLRNLYEADGQFTLCRSTRDELAQLLAEAAPLRAFIDECCRVDLARGVQATALYRIYQLWAEGRALQPLGEGPFGSELRSAVHTLIKDRATKPNQRERNGCRIVETDFDIDSTTRAILWLGISPRREWRTRNAMATCT